MKDNSKILVSVICITYNHERYIAEALDSFLMQKTNFAYEILVHDDASTDLTTRIIREYEQKYPDIIKTIYQNENQYSKGVKVGNFHKDIAKGKYIAVCEGDDFWIDSDKLQTQVDYMEANPDCSLCVHSAYRVNQNNKKMKIHKRPYRENRIYTTEDVLNGGGGLFATSSYIYPSKFSSSLPEFYYLSPVGDYPLTIYLALNGKVYYIDKFMSAYRVNVSGSWANRVSLNIKLKANHYYKMNQMFDEINKYTNYSYLKLIEKINYRREINFLLAQKNLQQVKVLKSDERYSDLSKIAKFRISLHIHFPKILDKLESLIRKYI